MKVRLVGLDIPTMPSKSIAFYKTSLSKPMDWHIWLRAKVSAIIQFITMFRPDSRDKYADMRYSWFVVVDDDTYVKV
jgi:hypothetical protein